MLHVLRLSRDSLNLRCELGQPIRPSCCRNPGMSCYCTVAQFLPAGFQGSWGRSRSWRMTKNWSVTWAAASWLIQFKWRACLSVGSQVRVHAAPPHSGMGLGIQWLETEFQRPFSESGPASQSPTGKRVPREGRAYRSSEPTCSGQSLPGPAPDVAFDDPTPLGHNDAEALREVEAQHDSTHTRFKWLHWSTQ
jgi:hypothetical protein